MNYLAHALLSFGEEEILTGNMLGDFVKGKSYLQYPLPVQHGILLHRFIDRATDEHPIVHEAISVFRPEFLLSGGVFTDIFFDHFLANDKRYFDEESLLGFTNTIYSTLNKYDYLFDDQMITFFSYMSKYNWLYHYRYMEGVGKSIRGICKRYPRLGDAEKALGIFTENYAFLQARYESFFPLLMEKTKEKLEELKGV